MLKLHCVTGKAIIIRDPCRRAQQDIGGSKFLFIMLFNPLEMRGLAESLTARAVRR